MEQESNIEQLMLKVKDYAKTYIELIKLESIAKFSKVVASATWRTFLLIFVLTSLLFLNIGAAFWVGDLLGKMYYGFFVIAGFYLVLALIAFVGRNVFIKKPLTDLIIKKLIN